MSDEKKNQGQPNGAAPDAGSAESISLPLDIVRALAPLAKAQGLDLGVDPEGKKNDPVTIPPVSLKLDPVTMGQMVGDQLRDEPIFVTPSGEVVELLPDGSTEPMEATRFVTWAGARIFFYVRSGDEGGRIRAGMKKDLASVLLAGNELRTRLRTLQRVMPVRVPVRGKDGVLRLLPRGYDAETEIFCMDRVRFDEDWPVEKAAAWLREFVKDFPWGDGGRSMAVWVCSALAPFCQLLNPALPPMFGFLANKAGSGKTVLAKAGPCAVYGHAGVLTWNREDGKLEEQLNSYARSNAPFIILDNVKGHVSSELLEAWLTTPTWEFRRFHHQSMIHAQKNTITYLSGNDATLSDDLIRRTLLVELFADMDADDRAAVRTSAELDEEAWASAEIRPALLAALWAMVRHWDAVGCPPGPTRMPSFVPWCRTIPGIVAAAGFADPCQKAEMISGGDKSRTEFEALLEAARAAHCGEGRESIRLPLPEWMAIARQEGLYYEVLGSVEEMHALMLEKRLLRPVTARPTGEVAFSPEDEAAARAQILEEEMAQAARYFDRSMSTKFGGILNRKRDNKKRLKDGAVWQFGSRKGKRSEFALVRVSAAETPDAATGDPF